MAGQAEVYLATWKEMSYPKLSRSEYSVTSSVDPNYNCIAWSIEPGDNRNWWPWDENYYWPQDVPREETLSAFVQLYRFYHYELCADGTLEAGFEKVVLYVEEIEGESFPTHAARQLCNGSWTSKLGGWEDIVHQTVSCLEGDYPAYGTAGIFFKRKEGLYDSNYEELI